MFLVERYLPGGSRDQALADLTETRRACEELAGEGTVVRHLSSMLVPEDETCFAFFTARSLDEVRQLIERTDIPYQRIVEAEQIGGEESASSRMASPER